MIKITSLLAWIGGFLFLNLYVNVIPKVWALGAVEWLFYALCFFLVAFLIGRYILKLSGLQGLGLARQKGWMRDLAVGFVIGASIWGLKYIALYSTGHFTLAGFMDPDFILGLLAQAMLGMFLSSAMNDVMIRGYWYRYLKNSNLLGLFILVTTTLYVLDDFWNESFSVQNILFSTIIGVSLAYTVLKTQAIWMSIGIHWGGNVLYRMMYGFDGQGIFSLSPTTDSPYQEIISLSVTLLLPLTVYLLLKNRITASLPEKVASNREARLIT